MDLNLVVFGLLGLSGVGLIILAFFGRAAWLTKSADIGFSKFGVQAKVNNNALIVVIGALLIFSLGYFAFSTDKGAIKRAESEKEEAVRKAAEEKEIYSRTKHEIEVEMAKTMSKIKDEMSKVASNVEEELLKKFELQLALDFEGVDNGSELDNIAFYKGVEIKVQGRMAGNAISVEGKDLDACTQGVRLFRQPDTGLKLVLTKVMQNDQITVDANYEKDGKRVSWWGSLVVPAVHFKLAKQGR